MELVDTHCHIQSIGLQKGERVTRELWSKAGTLSPDDVVEAAAEAGVTRLVCVGCDLEDSRLAIDFVQDRPNCWASIGIHPHEAKHYSAGQKADEFTVLAERPKVVAIGECGLDYFYGHSPREDQLPVFKFQLDVAVKTGLPVIFHVRDAFDDFWPAYDGYKGVRGVLHSFTDKEENLRKALDRGLMIGVNGIATFAKDPALLQVYRIVPLDRLLLETDAPFLTPAPDRGKINQPKQIGRIAEFMAELRGIDPASLASATTANARQLFGI